jgi:alpha-D-xyloside xylohydrolase
MPQRRRAPAGLGSPQWALVPQQLTEIRVYPGRASEVALYDDDGETYAYEKGQGRLTRLRWDDERGLTIKGDALKSLITGLTRVVR